VELRFLDEYMPSSDDYFSFQVVTLQVVFHVGVVFWFRTPLVKIHGVQVLDPQNNEGAILVSMQHNLNRPLCTQIKHNEINIYESILWR
jgi:hypothetical protein